MTDMFPPAVQRPKLLAFADAIDSRSDALSRDEYGDWRISGQHGHIYACPEGFQLVVVRDFAPAWANAKQRLSFCAVTQDGDTEGALILGRLPTPDEGEIIRKTLGIFKRRRLSEEHRQILQRTWFQRNPQAVLPAFGGPPGMHVPDAHLEGPAA